MSKTTPAAPVAKAEGPKLEEVTLLKSHRHKGELKPAGGKISVNAAERAWLVAHQIIAGEPQPEAKE